MYNSLKCGLRQWITRDLWKIQDGPRPLHINVDNMTPNACKNVTFHKSNGGLPCSKRKGIKKSARSSVETNFKKKSGELKACQCIFLLDLLNCPMTGNKGTPISTWRPWTFSSSKTESLWTGGTSFPSKALLKILNKKYRWKLSPNLWRMNLILASEY